MAISKDTAALVAAQLTQAWAAIYASKEGAGNLTPTLMEARVAETYLRFRDAVAEVDIGKPRYDIDKFT